MRTRLCNFSTLTSITEQINEPGPPSHMNLQSLKGKTSSPRSERCKTKHTWQPRNASLAQRGRSRKHNCVFKGERNGGGLSFNSFYTAEGFYFSFCELCTRAAKSLHRLLFGILERAIVNPFNSSPLLMDVLLWFPLRFACFVSSLMISLQSFVILFFCF